MAKVKAPLLYESAEADKAGSKIEILESGMF